MCGRAAGVYVSGAGSDVHDKCGGTDADADAGTTDLDAGAPDPDARAVSGDDQPSGLEFCVGGSESDDIGGGDFRNRNCFRE